MHRLIEQHRTEIEALCRQFPVRRLEVFGSVLREDFDPQRSDVDFLVELNEGTGDNLFEAYVDLRRALSDLLDRPVDLVMLGAVRNRYLRAGIDSRREVLYAA